MVKLNKIYTRTGDGGDTGLADGSRIAKDDVRVIAYGDVDETNAVIGLARRHAPPPSGNGNSNGNALDDLLARVQNDLFDLGADLSTPRRAAEENDGASALRIIASQVERLEQEIDLYNEALAPLTSFILPGGNDLAAYLHLARTVSRRAERSAVTLARTVTINPEAIKYLNRLSDLLFVLSRHANKDGADDVLWTPGKNR